MRPSRPQGPASEEVKVTPLQSLPQTHTPGHFKSGPALKVRRNRALGWGGQRGYRKKAGWENRQRGIAHLAGPTPARRFLRTRCRVLKPRGPLPRKPADTFLDTFLVGQKSIDHPLCKGYGAWRERKRIKGAQEKLPPHPAWPLANPPFPAGDSPPLSASQTVPCGAPAPRL